MRYVEEKNFQKIQLFFKPIQNEKNFFIHFSRESHDDTVELFATFCVASLRNMKPGEKNTYTLQKCLVGDNNTFQVTVSRPRKIPQPPLLAHQATYSPCEYSFMLHCQKIFFVENIPEINFSTPPTPTPDSKLQNEPIDASISGNVRALANRFRPCTTATRRSSIPSTSAGSDVCGLGRSMKYPANDEPDTTNDAGNEVDKKKAKRATHWFSDLFTDAESDSPIESSQRPATPPSPTANSHSKERNFSFV